VSGVFTGSFEFIDDTRQPGAEPVEYAAYVRETLTQLRPGDSGLLRIRRPKPTAAFSPQDTAHANYAQARDLTQRRGFTPVERGTGGRLTVFDEGALGITLVAPHVESHAHMMARYDIFAGAIAKGLKRLGIDARIGELPNEYCPGKFSINARGRVKLVGIAQRMTKHAYQMGAVISVARSNEACAAIADAYEVMSLPFDAATYGGINDLVPQATFEDVATAMRAEVTAILG
jgi:octanoyl-[GcvH]:protein N-octanoyltransferase